jgi:hypothetical protein
MCWINFTDSNFRAGASLPGSGLKLNDCNPGFGFSGSGENLMLQMQSQPHFKIS